MDRAAQAGGGWSYDRERRVEPARSRGDDFQAATGGSPGDDGHPWLDDAGLFGGDLLEGISKPLLVIEIDASDDAGQGDNDVGGVEPPAEAGFPDHEIAAFAREITQRHDRHHFKECRMRRLGETRGSPFT